MERYFCHERLHLKKNKINNILMTLLKKQKNDSEKASIKRTLIVLSTKKST